jgi:heptosyltransferase-1
MTPVTQRILIIRLSALGDILHALPLLGALRAHFPQAHLGWLVETAGAPLLTDHPMLDRLHVFPKKEWRVDKLSTLRGPLRALWDEVRAERYEISIDVQGLTKSAIWGKLAGAPRRIGFHPPDARELAPWMATQCITPPADARHIIERNMALLRPLGIAPPGPFATPVHLPAEARARAKAIVGENGAPLVVMSLGAGWASKVWAAERFAELAQRMVARHGMRVALAWGPGEERLIETACQALGVLSDYTLEALPPEPGIAILPRTTFVELGAVIAQAQLFVGGDTGPTHFASALGVRTVSMMGPLDARRNGPYGAHCITIQHGIPRRAPLGQNHRKWCDPLTDLKLVTVDEVYAACCRQLALGAAD